MKNSNAMNSDGLHFIWVLEKDRSAYLHVYKSLQKATSDLNTFSKIKRGSIDPSIGRTGSMGISQIGHGIGNSKMTIDDIATSVEKKYGVEPEVIRHDVANNPVKQTEKGFRMKLPKLKKVMTERERAEKLVYVISEMMAKRPTPKNIIQATDYLEGRFDMGSDIDDALLFKVEEKLKGKLPFLRKTKKNPVRQRIAVSLSRSQARKNPYLESGADISKRTDINRKAASMA